MKRNGVTSQVLMKGRAGVLGLDTEMSMAIDEMLDAQAPLAGTARLPVILRIRKSAGR
jgi:hypothetical protein